MHCLRSLPFVFAAAAVVFAGGCTETPVGLNCYIPSLEGSTTQIASPALDCESRLCLHMADQQDESAVPSGMCTAGCESSEDCVRHPQSSCESGFTCTIPMTVGDFCCLKMCVCKDFMVVPEAGATPAACNADDPNNTCCNLPGRPACGGGGGGGGGGGDEADAMPGVR